MLNKLSLLFETYVSTASQTEVDTWIEQNIDVSISKGTAHMVIRILRKISQFPMPQHFGYVLQARFCPVIASQFRRLDDKVLLMIDITRHTAKHRFRKITC